MGANAYKGEIIGQRQASLRTRARGVGSSLRACAYPFSGRAALEKYLSRYRTSPRWTTVEKDGFDEDCRLVSLTRTRCVLV